MSMVQCWWHSFGPFPPKGAKGQYPSPGAVVIYYRQRLGMTRQMLAQTLGMSISMACRMEKESIGLDSITRCRKLVSLLDIPAFLLSLDSLAHLEEKQRPWWLEEGYPAFDKGDDGYPLIGQVLKYYRERKLQQLQQKKGKDTYPEEEKWTQHGLAMALGVSEFTVRKMENYQKGLDSITRRQALSFFLNIPPVLLGLDMLDHTTVVEQEQRVTIHRAKPKTLVLETDVFRKYHRIQEELWTEHFTYHGQGAVNKAQRELKYLQEVTSLTRGRQQQKIIEMQSLCYQFIAAVALEKRAFDTLFTHENRAVAYAKGAANNELIASALLRRAMAYYGRGKIRAAIGDIDEAMMVSKDASGQVRGTVLQNAGMIHAHMIQSNADITSALNLLDQAEAIARSGNLGEDEYFLRFNVGMYHIRRAIALIAVGHSTEKLRKGPFTEALYQLELAERNTGQEMTRRHGMINLFRAQAHYGLGEYGFAVKEALLALDVFKEIHSDINIGYITELYYKLGASSYKNAPLVLRLGWELSKLGE
ncbi:MAG TPA: hypothetical protein VFU49_19545 [Ktedonobacteraceae bacterium]|nr:hypothetical protein [Ktedonobacteraceae bacterium]